MDTTVPVHKNRRAYPDTPEGRAKHAEAMRRWHKNHPNWYKENHAKRKAAGTTWVQKHPLEAQRYQRSHHLMEQYGITVEQYDFMLKLQGGVCKSCGGPPTGRYETFQVDHDHVTKENRGLVCWTCNVIIGHARDSQDRLHKVIKYLSKS